MGLAQAPDVWIRQSGNGKTVSRVNGHINHNNDEAAELIIFDAKHKNRRFVWWTNFRNIRLIRWIRNRLNVDDNAKRADLISSERFFWRFLERKLIFFSGVLFPTLFVCFNFVYWTKYSQYHAPEAK